MHGYTKTIPLDTDATLAANSDAVAPSQKAIKSYAVKKGTVTSSGLTTSGSCLLGGSGAGPVEEVTCSAQAKALLDDETAVAMQTTLGISDYLHAEDQKASGSSGGASTAGWQRKTLNTTVASYGSSITRAGNAITIAAGTYRVEVWSPAYGCGRHCCAIATGASAGTGLVAIGQQAYTTDYAEDKSHLLYYYTVSESTTFYVDHYCEGNRAINGLGVNVSAGVNVVFTQIEVRRIR